MKCEFICCQKVIGEFAKFVHKRYDNTIFYSNANEHALGYHHRNCFHGRFY